MPEEYFLQTLGVPRLMTAGGHDIRIRVRKHLAVLVVLAVDGGRIRRDRLVSMFWPYSRPDRARGSLATAVSYLRGKLGGGAIEPGRDFVELMPGLVALDLDRLEAGEIIGDDFSPVLEVDGFLRGFELERLVEFESWRDRQHARLLPAIEKALITLTDHSRRSGDINALARYADKLLELNDLSEWGIKARMEAYALSGDRITALRVYDDWVERLKEELDAAPAQMVESLANRLRRRHWNASDVDSVVAVVKTEQWRDRLFIGRAREFRVLYDLWERTRRGDTSHVLVRGDSGVGKTTLADRFATALALEGASIARARCYELERGIPYATIGSIVDPLLGRPGVSATSPESLADLARILPSVRRRFPHISVNGELTGDSARIRFAEATIDLVGAVADENPLLVVLDDFDQADEASLAILHILARRTQGRPIMVALVSSNRHRFTTPSAPLTFCGLSSHFTELLVEALEVEESEALLDALAREAGVRPTPSERKAILDTAAGVPLALELLLDDWRHYGSRSAAIAIRAMTNDVEATPESRFAQVIANLFAGFDEDEQIVVNVAAILDRRVGDLHLYETSGVRQGNVLATLSRMVERRVLREGPHGLEWINPSLRACAYLAIPKSLRRMLHEAIAGELLRQVSGGASIPNLEIAWHCMRSGRVTDAAVFLLEGARDAMLHGAPHEAELALSSGIGGIDSPYREEATLLLAEALLELSRPAEVITLLERPEYPQALHFRKRDLLVLRARELLREVGSVEREEVVRRICQFASDGAEKSAAVLAVVTGTHLLHTFERSDLAQQLLRASASIDQTILDPFELLSLLVSQAKLEYIHRRLDAASALIARARQIADQNNIRNSAYLAVLNGLGAIATARGQYEDALSYSRLMYAEAQQTYDFMRAATGACNTAMALCRLGLYSEAMKWAERTCQSVSAFPHTLCMAYEFVGISAVMMGSCERALSAVDALLGQEHADPTGSVRTRAKLAAADILMMVGDSSRAMELVEDLPLSDASSFSDLGITGTVARWQTLVGIKDGRVKDTADALRQLLQLPLDALDRSMVLAALKTIGCLSPGGTKDLELSLEWLPGAIPDQLRKLGLLKEWAKPRKTLSRVSALSTSHEDA